MTAKIAVFFDEKNKLATMSEIDKIVIYEKREVWEVIHVIQEMNVSLNTLPAMRNYIMLIAERLGDCKFVVGAEILGVAYHLLSSLGIEMIEASQYSEFLLDQIAYDYIYKDNLKGADNKEAPVIPKEPYPVGEDGKYYLDMVLLQEHHPEMTSKKAILPFLDHTNFYELTILCPHEMPWLAVELPKRGLLYEAENSGSHCKVKIYKKVCGQ